MKLAFLILAHNNPVHLKRMVKALDHNHTLCYIHIDKKSDLSAFPEMTHRNAFYIPNRIFVNWGGFSIVQATLNLLEHAVREDQFDYFILLSGADYPIKSIDQILHFFIANKKKEFINIVKMPCEKIGKPDSRLKKYHIEGENTWKNNLNIGIRTLFSKIGLKPGLYRDYHKRLGVNTPYADSQWWALSSFAYRYILNFVKQNKNFVDFYRHTVIPDEMFFQTILGNSPFKRNIERNIERNLTYTDWSEEMSGPAVLSDYHIKIIAKNEGVYIKDIYGEGKVLFARKFTDESGRLIHAIDVKLK